MSTTRDMAGALNHRSGLTPIDNIARDEKLAMDPPVSEAQRRWAFANKGKSSAEGKAATEFANADPGGKLPATAKDCDADDVVKTHDAMTNEELDKYEKEKENAPKMAPKDAANIGRYGGRGSEKSGSRDFTRKDEYNEAGTK